MADTPAAEAPKKKGGMKKIIMIVVILLAVGGAGFGGMMVGKKQGAKTVVEKPKGAAEEIAGEATEKEAAEGGEGEAAGGHGEAPKEKAEGGGHGEAAKEGEGATTAKEPEELTFDLDKLTVNLADPSGRRYVQVTLQLLASSPKALKEIQANKAPLVDATLTLLGTKTREDLQPPAARDRLKRELMTRFDGIITPKSIAGIYITQMVFQ
jgi:flagellar FliL protein